MTEVWERWNPLEGIAGKYDVDYILDGKNGFIIRLYSDKDTKKIDILFEHYADAYKHTNESFWFKTCGDLSAKYGGDFYADWAFFKVKNSEYLAWLSEKSATWSDQFPFMHFCMMGTDSVVEVLARYEPTVTFVEEK